LKKTAILFPGQGSQKVGMASELYKEYEIVREIFDMAEEITKTNLSGLCFNGPIETLTQTVNLQPAITTVNLSYFSILKKEGITFDITAGHSLGEYSALTAAGVITAETALRLVNKRGSLMHSESLKQEGAMSAIINIDAKQLQSLITENEGSTPDVCIANHNTEAQIVISGTPSAVKRISKIVKKSGGMAIALKVSGAWHSPLMKGVEAEFKEFLSDADFSIPDKQIIFNVSADLADDTKIMKRNMVDQLCSPVRWYDTISRMLKDDVHNYIEVGPGNVLSGLVKKVTPDDYPGKVFSVNSIKNLELFLKGDI